MIWRWCRFPRGRSTLPDGLQRDAVGPILEAIERLRQGADERRSLARRSLDSALAGLPEAAERIAAEVDREQEAAAALRRPSIRAIRRHETSSTGRSRAAPFCGPRSSGNGSTSSTPGR